MNFKICFAFISLIAIFSCNRTPEAPNYIEINPEFAHYIALHTSGLVSSQSSIQIVMQQPLDSAWLQGGLSKKILQFKPALAGDLTVKNSNTLVFTPDVSLQQGEIYTATLALNRLYNEVPKELQKFQFQFQTRKQDFAVYILGFDSHSEGDDSLSLKGELHTNDITDPTKIEQMLTAVADGKNLEVRWNHNSDATRHHFTLLNIPQKSNSQNIELRWDGKPIGVKRTHNNQLKLPARDELTITHVSVLPQTEQVINVNFSQVLDTEKFLDGLVEIVVNTREEDSYDGDEEGNEILVKNVVAQGNNLRIYPSKNLGGDVRIVLHPGIRSKNGQVLNNTHSVNLQLSHLQPSVKFIGSGNIIPNSKEVLLPFEAVGLRAVRVEITQIYENNMLNFFQRNRLNESNDLRFVGKKIFRKVISLDDQTNYNPQESKIYQLELSKIIEHESGAVYNIEFSFDQEFSAFNCGHERKESFLTPVEKDLDPLNMSSSSQVYDSEYDYYSMYPEGYSWDERNNPCHVSYYNAERKVNKNVLASNLGIIVKSGQTNYSQIVVTNLLTAEPESNVDIIAYDLQNQEVGKAKTGTNGMAVMQMKGKAFYMKATKSKQRAYIRLDDGSAQSVSTFDVSGESIYGNMAGFLYGERGVWRPGDSIHLTFVLNKNWVKTPSHLPAILEFRNPDGQIMQREINAQPVGGFYAFHLQTPAEAQTGNWLATVSVGDLKFQKTLKIETIKPNRLKIETEFDSQILSSHDNNQIQIAAQWLTGASARNLGASVVATVHAAKTEFAGWENFIFDDATRSFDAVEQLIFDGSLNENGRAIFNPQISNEIAPPGMLQLGLFTKVFEPGGDFSSKYDLKKYSPYDNYVGLKIPGSTDDYSSLPTNRKNTIQLASVNENGQASSADAEVKIYKLKRSWWYNSDQSDLAYYVSGSYENLYKTQIVDIKNGRGSFDLEIPDNDWGNYYLQICDKESGHCAGKTVWLDYPYWRGEMDISDEGASVFQFTTDKSSYQVGETALVTLPQNMEGKVLVSIENGLTVLSQRWATPEKEGNSIQVKITDQMAPNAYLYISMIQPHGNMANDLPIRMYGMTPLNVENPEKQLKPLVKAPNEIKPNSQYQIAVSEQNGKPMTYTLAVVDEGLLDITNFKTPDIHAYFNRKQALGVKTWDVFNYVLGAYGGRVESVFAIGGDMALQAQNKEKINRFKPVVKYLGPFTLQANESANHSLQMENYVGSVKVMVVAGNEDGAYGSTEQAIGVKQSLMTLATLPRVLNPGDEVELPITVFAMDNRVKNVQIEVQSSGLVSLDQNTASLQFAATGDQTRNFKIQVPEQTGSAHLKIIARSGEHLAQDEIDIEIRYPNPPITEIIEQDLSQGKSWETTFSGVGLPGTRNNVLQLSAIPPMRLEKRLNFLLQYPHGCLEQVTSGLFAQLYLPQLIELNDVQKAKIQNNIQAGLLKIKNQQLANGGLSYWPGNTGADEWASTYALHFIHQAESLGYQIPVGLKSGLIQYTANESKRWNYYQDKTPFADLQQAYRLFSLALTGNTELAVMNRFREKDLNPASSWMLVNAYAKAGQIEVARNLAHSASQNIQTYTSDAYTYGSTLRDEAIILLALNGLKDTNKAGVLMRQIASKLNSDQWHSTQTTAFALLSIADFLNYQETVAGIVARIEINGRQVQENSTFPVINIQLPENSGKLKIGNLQNSYLFAQIISSGVPMYYTNGGRDNTNLQLQVSFLDLNNEPIDVSSLKQGTDFKAVTTIKHPGYLGAYHDLALTHMFPAGWEIINTRYQETAQVSTPFLPDYQDFRDDRVNSYFDLQPGQKMQITTLLNATYGGSYHMPAVWCEAMYDQSISAVIPSKKVKVIP